MTPRKKRVLNAFVIAVVLAVLMLLVSPPPVVATDPLSLALNVMVLIVLGFPLAYLLFSPTPRLWRWWRTRHPLPSPPAPGSVERFRWTGRPARANSRTVLAVTLLFGGMAAIVFLIASAEPRPSPFPWILGWLIVAVLGLFVVSTGLMSHTVALEVDEDGVRCRGMYRSSFARQWNEIGRIEFVPMEKVHPFDLFNADVGSAMGHQRMYALMDREGKMAAGLTPQGMLGRDLGSRLEAALLTQASKHGIPVVEIRWRDMLRWRKSKSSVGSD